MKYIHFVSILLLFNTMATSCVTGNKAVSRKTAFGTYSIQYVKTLNSDDSIMIKGHIHSNDSAVPLAASAIIVDDKVYPTDDRGIVQFKLPPGRYKLVARSVGYQDVSTPEIKLILRKDIQVTFTLKSIRKPIE